MRKELCNGKPSLTNYAYGCRCGGCRFKKSDYESERRRIKRMESSGEPRVKKPSGRRDSPFVVHDAFTREQILEARKKL